jgi:hypothetical protein
MAASLWRMMIGVDVKVFRICCRALFYCSWSVCSRFFCRFHHISAPKSDLEVTRLVKLMGSCGGQTCFVTGSAA